MMSSVSKVASRLLLCWLAAVIRHTAGSGLCGRVPYGTTSYGLIVKDSKFWDDLNPLCHFDRLRVAEVRVWSKAEEITGIQVIYDMNGKQQSSSGHPETPDPLSQLQVFKLHDYEVITGVSGHEDSVLDRLTLSTNLGQTVHFGPFPTENFSLKIPEGKAVLALFGRLGSTLLSVGAHYAAPQTDGWFENVQDCVVSEWHSCEICSVTCGTSTSLCKRDIKVQAQNSGKVCPPLVGLVPCGTSPCPVDCTVTTWAAWGPCEASCGASVQRRTRVVQNPSLFGGGECPVLEETKPCAKETPCPVDCNITWKCGNACSVTCGGGVSLCQGYVQTEAAHGGEQCPEYNGEDQHGVHIVTQERKCAEGPCTVDCVVSEWGPWGACSKSCGVGHETRYRSVVTDALNGGSCPPLQEVKECYRLCPVDCVMAEWGPVSQCSKSCSGGKMTRTRGVISVAEHGGKACPDHAQSWSCNPDPCPVDCELSAWTGWGSCERTCGSGSQARIRVVVQAPAAGGVACGTVRDERSCNTAGCPSDCALSAWEHCSPCSLTCGGGVQSCTRRILHQPAAGGKACPGTLSSDEVPCGATPCSRDCELSQWTGWSACTQSCGGGSQYRVRKVLQEPVQGGKACGQMSQTQVCELSPCPLDCELSEWSEWSACSKSCDGGKQTRSRHIVRQALHGGQLCYLSQMSGVRLCATPACAQNCTLTEWGEYSACSTSCGTGEVTRRRAVLMEATGGGLCLDPLTDTIPCIKPPCAVDCEVGEWKDCGDCSQACGTGHHSCQRDVVTAPSRGGKPCPALVSDRSCNAEPCAADCVLSEWTPWGDCSETCSGGSQHRYRSVLQHANEAAPCGSTKQTQACATQPCPVDCLVGDWGAWGACSRTCGGGHRYRSKKLLRSPAFGGAACLAGEHEKGRCAGHACPVDCMVSLFGHCSACSHSCGGGVQTCKRMVTVPSMFGGKQCPVLVKTLACATEPCEVPCSVGAWPAWGPCTLSCGGGHQMRSRAVLVRPQNGGAECPTINNYRQCNPAPCPVDCEMGSWSDWTTECSTTCGGGVFQRSRALVVAPAHGGSPCHGRNETKPCNGHPCPVDCGVTPWSEWSSCTKSCDNGLTVRQRHILYKPRFGGKPCPGTFFEQVECNTHRCVLPICHRDHVRCHLHEDAGTERVVVTHGKDFMAVAGHFHCLMSGPFGERPVENGADVTESVAEASLAAVADGDSPDRRNCHHVQVRGLEDGVDPTHKLMGVYVLELTKSFGKPLYRSGSSYLYYYQDDSRKQWIVGANPGANQGWMVVDDDAEMPALIQSDWLLADEHTMVWRTVDQVKVDCADACGTIELAGVDSSNAMSRLMGHYALLSYSRFGRPVYQSRHGRYYLYYYHTQWMLGGDPEKDVGWLYSTDAAHRPQDILMDQHPFCEAAAGAAGAAGRCAQSFHLRVNCSLGCNCRCNRHPGCCSRKGFVLKNADLGKGNMYNGVTTAEECCQKCTNHPLCSSWVYSTLHTCVLKSGPPEYEQNLDNVIQTWAGTRAKLDGRAPCSDFMEERQ